MDGTIAVSVLATEKWGCPHCGYRSGHTRMSGHGAAIWVCGECQEGSVFLADGVTVSPFGIGGNYPKLQPHPREGIPSHGRPDKHPETGGEFFSSRGIGLEGRLACFCCDADKRENKPNSYLNNIAAFVECKAAGERVVAMFKQGARLDYREYEPDRVQVKIGACDKHLENLKYLDNIVNDGVITEEKVKKAIEKPEMPV